MDFKTGNRYCTKYICALRVAVCTYAADTVSAVLVQGCCCALCISSCSSVRTWSIKYMMDLVIWS
jgi:hypothetical protein